MQARQQETALPPHDERLTMPPESLRLTKLMEDACNRAFSESPSQIDLRQALSDSWKVLSIAGYTRFGSVAELRPPEFAAHIKATRPDMTGPLATALDIIAWYQFSHLEGTPDKAVQFLQRANLLSPQTPLTLLHFADSAIALTDAHLWRMQDPTIRRATLNGYRASAQDAILLNLKSEYDISEEMIRGRAPSTIEERVERLTQGQRTQVYNLLGKLATLCDLSGTDRGRLGLLNLSLAASSSQLALLGNGRNISLLVAELIERLGDCRNHQEIGDVLQEKSPSILNILAQLGTTTWNKGNLLVGHLQNAPDRETRQSMERENMLMHSLSEDIDAILDLLEPTNP